MAWMSSAVLSRPLRCRGGLRGVLPWHGICQHPVEVLRPHIWGLPVPTAPHGHHIHGILCAYRGGGRSPPGTQYSLAYRTAMGSVASTSAPVGTLCSTPYQVSAIGSPTTWVRPEAWDLPGGDPPVHAKQSDATHLLGVVDTCGDGSQSYHLLSSLRLWPWAAGRRWSRPTPSALPPTHAVGCAPFGSRTAPPPLTSCGPLVPEASPAAPRLALAYSLHRLS